MQPGGQVRCAVALGALMLVIAGAARAADDHTRPTWKPARTIKLDGVIVTVSEPVRVAESKGYLWFPTLVRVDGDRLLAIMSNKPDAHTDEQTGTVAWSDDGGLTWGPAKDVPVYSECPLNAADGLLLLPNYMFPQRADSIGAPYLFCPRGRAELSLVKQPVRVTGWPRPLDRLGEVFGHPELHVAGFVFNGQCVTLKNGGYLATLYGRFKSSKRYALVVAESNDGRAWRVRSIVADENCKLPGDEGPCEAALCRLKDGRLLCVFRLEGSKPYGRAFSSDDGRTWTDPNALPFGSVQPSLAVLPDGVVALSGGRPGVSVWLNLAGDAENWQPVELLPPGAKTSAYTEVVALDDHNLLCIYDRIPHGWNAIPAGSPDVNSVWVVHLTLEKGR